MLRCQHQLSGGKKELCPRRTLFALGPELALQSRVIAEGGSGVTAAMVLFAMLSSYPYSKGLRQPTPRVCLLAGLNVVDRSRAVCWRQGEVQLVFAVSFPLEPGVACLHPRIYLPFLSPVLRNQTRTCWSRVANTYTLGSGVLEELVKLCRNACIPFNILLQWRICNVVEVLAKTKTSFQAPPPDTVFFSAPVDLHRLLLMECW